MRLQIVSKLDHPKHVTQIDAGIAAAAVLGVVMIGLIGMALLLPPFSVVWAWFSLVSARKEFFLSSPLFYLPVCRLPTT